MTHGISLTLCIAARFPWGIMARLPEPPVPQAILFATDSRLTDLRTNRTLDIGEKLFPICDIAGLVFSGSYEIGIESVRKLRNNIERKKIPLAKEIAEIAELTFEQQFRKINSPNKHLSLMLGVYDHGGDKTLLLGFKSPNFQPVEMNGVNAIGGTPEIQELYKRKFDEFVEQHFHGGGGVSDNPMEWLNFMQIILGNTVIEMNIHPRIGGLVQTAIIDKNGFSWVGHGLRKPSGKWILTERADGSWRIVEADSKRIIARTERDPEQFFKISD